MFDKIRYEFNGTEIDRNRNVGITSLMKGYASYSDDFVYYMEIAGFPHPVFDQTVKRLIICDRYFNFYISLGILLGFCEDYKHVVINPRHELILIRAMTIIAVWEIQRQNRNLNCSRYKRMSNVTLNEVNKLSMLSLGEQTISKFPFMGSV